MGRYCDIDIITSKAGRSQPFNLLGLLAGFRVAADLRRETSWAGCGMFAVTGAETDALFQTANAKRLSPEISRAFCCPSNLHSG